MVVNNKQWLTFPFPDLRESLVRSRVSCLIVLLTVAHLHPLTSPSHISTPSPHPPTSPPPHLTLPHPHPFSLLTNTTQNVAPLCSRNLGQAQLPKVRTFPTSDAHITPLCLLGNRDCYSPGGQHGIPALRVQCLHTGQPSGL